MTKAFTQILSIILAVILVTGMAYAGGSAEVDETQTEKVDNSQNLSTRQNKEKRKSTGKRKSTSESTGNDKQWQDAKRDVEQEQNNTSADITMPLEGLFMVQILKLEKTTPPFSQCRLMTHPKQVRDYGLSAIVGTNDVDSNLAQNLTGLANSNGPVGDFQTANVLMLKNTKRCMAFYGGIIAQAFLNTERAIAALTVTPAIHPEPVKQAPAKYVKKVNGRIVNAGKTTAPAEQKAFGKGVKIVTDEQGRRRITGIGHDDYLALATEALKKALKDGITDERIAFRYDELMQDKGECFFAGSTDRILCGSSLLVLGAKQQLFAAGDVEVYGHSFMGLNGAYRLSKSWSLSKAVEKMASVSQYEKFAKEVNRYAEDMESKGRSLEAAQARSLAIEAMKSGKTGLSLNSIIPGIHGQ